VLLYQPDDKRIQSFFLGGRYPTPEQTRSVSEALRKIAGEQREPPTLRQIAEPPTCRCKKTRVVLSFLKDAGYAREIGGTELRADVRGPPDLPALARAARRYEQKRAQDRARLESMLRYAQSHLCRNKLLFAYFGYAEDAAEPCGTCDNCVRPREDAVAHEAEAAERRRRAEPTARHAGARRLARDAVGGAALLLEQAITRRRARANRARALRIERRRRWRCRGPSSSAAMWSAIRLGRGRGRRNVAGDTVGAYFPGHGDKLLKAKFLEKVGEA
jgi:ATP-dependent DNA helicase RecQ